MAAGGEQYLGRRWLTLPCNEQSPAGFARRFLPLMAVVDRAANGATIAFAVNLLSSRDNEIQGHKVKGILRTVLALQLLTANYVVAADGEPPIELRGYLRSLCSVGQGSERGGLSGSPSSTVSACLLGADRAPLVSSHESGSVTHSKQASCQIFLAEAPPFGVAVGGKEDAILLAGLSLIGAAYNVSKSGHWCIPQK